MDQIADGVAAIVKKIREKLPQTELLFTLTYRMTGKVEGDSIKAQARTTLDGSEATNEWSAKRK